MPFIELENLLKIWYDLIGSGPFLVLNHGYGSSHKSLQFIADKLKNSFTCVLWDQRGQGDTDKPLKSTYEDLKALYTIDQIAEDCFHLLKKLDILKEPNSKVYMYGHSMGGMVSLKYALKYPETLKSLAVGSTTAKNIDSELKSNLELVKQGKIEINRKYFKNNAPNGFTEAFVKLHPEYLMMLVEDKMKVPKDVTIALLDNFINHYDIENELKSLIVPTLILHGTEDSTIKIDSGKSIHNLIPNSKFIPIAHQKHEINKEIPDIIANHIYSFFIDFPSEIATIDSIISEIIQIFNNIEIIDPKENEEIFFKTVGKYSSSLKQLLNIYFDSSREIQLEYKPDILFYRQVQHYLVFLLRYPEILKVKEHDEIQQTKKFLEHKDLLIERLYKQLADEQTALFEGDFPKKLEEELQSRSGISDHPNKN